jgi:four helix bundle protein
VPSKFEKLEVWQLTLEYVDLVYDIASQLPRSEEYNLKSQMIRAATSVTLNMAEGSTSQADAERARFLGMGIPSLLETVACQHLIKCREYLQDTNSLRQAYGRAEILAAKLHAMRKRISPEQSRLREDEAVYERMMVSRERLRFARNRPSSSVIRPSSPTERRT